MKEIDMNTNKAEILLTVATINGFNATLVTSEDERIYIPKDIFPNIKVGNVYEFKLNAAKTEDNQKELKKKRIQYFGRKLIHYPMDYYNKIVYDLIMEQVDNINEVKFGRPLSILIVSDRLPGVAMPLATLLRKDKDTSVAIVTSLDDSYDALEYSYDYVIIVGYLEDKKTYRVLRSARNNNLDVISILYAGIDESTRNHKNEFHIDHLFERDRPILEFYEFIKKLE